MTACPVCGAADPGEHAFCIECGADLEAMEDAPPGPGDPAATPSPRQRGRGPPPDPDPGPAEASAATPPTPDHGPFPDSSDQASAQGTGQGASSVADPGPAGQQASVTDSVPAVAEDAPGWAVVTVRVWAVLLLLLGGYGTFLAVADYSANYGVYGLGGAVDASLAMLGFFVGAAILSKQSWGWAALRPLAVIYVLSGVWALIQYQDLYSLFDLVGVAIDGAALVASFQPGVREALGIPDLPAAA